MCLICIQYIYVYVYVNVYANNGVLRSHHFWCLFLHLFAIFYFKHPWTLDF